MILKFNSTLMLLCIICLQNRCAAAKTDILKDVEKLCSPFCAAPSAGECKKKLPEPDIYLPMDKLVGNKIEGKGVEAVVRGYPKPSLTTGHFGSAISLANTQTLDDKFIDLGYLRGRCVDNLEKCKDGLTVSLWFWHDYIYDWPCIMSASQWQIHTHAMPGNSNEVYLNIIKSGGPKRIRLGGDWNTSVSNGEWHHVAFVYRDYENVRLFVDGELIDGTARPNSDLALSGKVVQIGCHIGGNCMKGRFDDLKIWERALSDKDIKEIYDQPAKPLTRAKRFASKEADFILTKEIVRLCSRYCANRPVTPCEDSPDVYAPLDEIKGTISPGIPINVKLSGDPTIVDGHKNKAIHTPNSGTYDDNYLTIGEYDPESCMYNIDKCDNGYTISFWFKIDENNQRWPQIASAAEWSIWTEESARNNQKPYMYWFHNGNKYALSGSPHLKNGEWHHMALVVRSGTDVSYFLNGVKIAGKDDMIYSAGPDVFPPKKKIQFGCYKEQNCISAAFDEVKIWEEAKSDEEIKAIFQAKKRR